MVDNLFLRFQTPHKQDYWVKSLLSYFEIYLGAKKMDCSIHL